MNTAHPHQSLWTSSISPISPVEERKKRGTQNGRDNARKRSGRLTRPLITLPIVKAREKAAEETGKKFGGDAWDRAKGLWATLRPKVEAKPPVQKVV
jgi:hypothetical protein